MYNASPSGWMWQGDVYRPGNIFRGNKNVNYSWHQSSLGAIDFTIEFVSEASNYGGITLHIDYAS